MPSLNKAFSTYRIKNWTWKCGWIFLVHCEFFLLLNIRAHVTCPVWEMLYCTCSFAIQEIVRLRSFISGEKLSPFFIFLYINKIIQYILFWIFHATDLVFKLVKSWMLVLVDFVENSHDIGVVLKHEVKHIHRWKLY